ncbi:MAG: hypothetical protein U0835_22170 [Isosphaeraceae bacterium]
MTAVFGLTTATILINREKERTEVNFQLARGAVDTLLTQLGDVELADIPGAEGVRQDMLEKARTYYDKFLAQQGGRLSVRQGTGQAYTRAGKILELLGQYRQAEERYRRAIALLNQLTTARGLEADVYRRDLAEARHNLGVLLTRLGRYEEARTELTAAVDTRTRLAARKDATDADRAAEQDSVYRLGALLARRPGNREQAQAYYTRAISQAEARLKGAEKEATDDDAVRRLARYRNQLAMLLRWSDAPKAASLLLQTADALELLHKKRPNVVETRLLLARVRNNLAALYSEKAYYEEASKFYLQADGLFDSLSKDYPKVPDYRFRTGHVASSP